VSLDDPIAGLLLSLVIILIAAKLGGHAAARFGQPQVLGELTAGVIVGNLTLAGFTGLNGIKTDPLVDMLARLGVIILLFQVGLESSVTQMRRVGVPAVLAAACGVVASFGLGWGVGAWLLPGGGPYGALFLGATITATSVSITTRVLKDLGRSQSDEARIVLGAAIVDDVIGLVMLAVITGLLAALSTGGGLGYSAVGVAFIKATAFLVGSLAIGAGLSPYLFSLASRLQAENVLLAAGLAICFLFAWLASAAGLAPIIGAFAAGLILEEVHFRDFVGRGERSLQELMAPIASFLVPIFFVVIGARADLTVFAKPGALGLALALSAAAILGKLCCALGVIGRPVDRVAIGLGMVPRGEVQLVFANAGLTFMVAGRALIAETTYAAIVVMVIVTTIVTPPALKWRLGKRTG
jgi:Kef-type K+ transport system membrane component KefB